MESRSNTFSVFNAYQYLFYRIYIWQLNSSGERNNPKFTALVGNSLLLAFNILTLSVMFQIVTGYSFRIEKIYGLIGTILLYIINYFLLLQGKKSHAIIKKFSAENDCQRKKRTIYCCMYALFTFLSFIISVIILAP